MSATKEGTAGEPQEVQTSGSKCDTVEAAENSETVADADDEGSPKMIREAAAYCTRSSVSCSSNDRGEEGEEKTSSSPSSSASDSDAYSSSLIGSGCL